MARAENASQIVLGATRRSRLTEAVGGSVINRVLREIGSDRRPRHLDRGDQWRSCHCPVRPGGARRCPLAAGSWVGSLAVAGPPVLCVTLVPVRADLGLESILLLFLALAVAIAAVGSARPRAARRGVELPPANWYFTPPIHTFTIAEAEQLLALRGVPRRGGRWSPPTWPWHRDGPRRPLDARAEATTLARLAAGDDADPARLQHVVEHLQETFDVRGAALLGRDHSNGDWVPLAAAGAGPPQVPGEADLRFDVPVHGGEAVLVVAGDVDAGDQAVLAAFAHRLGDALDTRRLTASAAEAAELARGNELRGALLAAVSHDLRTPLAAIKASVTSLLADDVEWPPESVRDFCESIDDETDRLTALVSDLLDMSRITTGSLHVQLADVGVDELIPAAVASLGDRVGPSRVELDVAETLPRVRTDPVLIERALANLVANAVAWSPLDVPVSIRAGAVPGAVVVQIADRGPGIAVSERERVFRPFQRLGDGRDGSPGGVGLGLAVARGFVEAVGAELLLDDTPGGGTTMVLSLPTSAGDGDRP